jgi:23S rRNA (guanosine2251-2'-O)-methyltransferase
VDILYGRNPVLEALRSNRPARKLMIADSVKSDSRIDQILALAERAGIEVERAQRRKLDDIAHTEQHQGVTGYFHARTPLTLDQLLELAQMPGLLIALDGIQDPQNLGAIVRSAAAAGADGVLISRQNATAVTPAAVKASAGMTEHLPIATVANLAQALDTLAGAGYWRVGLDGGLPTRYDKVDYTVATVIVVGAEGRGLGELTRKKCDVLVSLPLAPRVESLNAGAAAAIALYEAARQRGFTRQ